MPFPMRREGRGCQTPTVTPHQAEAHTETSKDWGPEHILSSIKISKYELQPHMSRIPIRRAASTERHPADGTKTSPTCIDSVSPGEKEESATMRVWKLLKPGLHHNRSVCTPPMLPVNTTCVSAEEGAKQLPSKALMKESPDRSLQHTGDTIIERADEEEETVQQLEETPAMLLPETVTLYREA
ncbi:uncharacterized protein ACO6RY_10050 [Pungitius sinensis]